MIIRSETVLRHLVSLYATESFVGNTQATKDILEILGINPHREYMTHRKLALMVQQYAEKDMRGFIANYDKLVESLVRKAELLSVQ